jgi:hypothetical protein
MFFFLSTEMLFKAITKQSPLWDRLFWRSSCGRSTTHAGSMLEVLLADTLADYLLYAVVSRTSICRVAHIIASGS